MTKSTPNEVQPVKLAIIAIISAILWFTPPPTGLNLEGWHAFILFVATIVSLIVKPLPMGACSLITLTIAIVGGVVDHKRAFSAFGNPTVWLVVFALFIAHGFKTTGLSQRIGYFFSGIFGKKTLGLGYGFMLTDLMLAPSTPSVTGRSAGIIFPIIKSVADAYDSKPNDPSSRKIGAFLSVLLFQGTVLSSTMFMTAMAANPILATLVADAGLPISWGDWAIAASIPGALSFLLIPLLVYWIYPPEIKDSKEASLIAKQKLKDMGAMSSSEIIMSATILLLLGLWISGSALIHPTVAAAVGLGILIVCGVLKWTDLTKMHAAFEIFIWFCVLIFLASLLRTEGVLDWFLVAVKQVVGDTSWTIAFPAVALLYFYVHYFFASSTAHVGALFPAFLGLSIAIGTPPMLAMFILVFFSSLFGGLTHYSLAPAPILFGAGYVSLKDWWKVGFAVSILNIAIWSSVGPLWWKALGYW